jgi:hypothetical protein
MPSRTSTTPDPPALSDDGLSTLNHVYVEQPDFEPALSFVHLSRKARQQRGQVFRPDARRMLRLLDAMDGREERQEPRGPSRRWRVIHEE